MSEQSEPRAVEEPCSVTGKPCNWLSEEWYDDAGGIESWDLFCQDCYRWRDWSKDEAPAEQAPAPEGTP